MSQRHAHVAKPFRTILDQFCPAVPVTDDEAEQENHRPGELNGYGRCLDCGESFAACPGVYWCPYCSEG